MSQILADIDPLTVPYKLWKFDDNPTTSFLLQTEIYIIPMQEYLDSENTNKD